MGNDTAITEMTVHDHAQYALGMLNCSHPAVRSKRLIRCSRVSLSIAKTRS